MNISQRTEIISNAEVLYAQRFKILSVMNNRSVFRFNFIGTVYPTI